MITDELQLLSFLDELRRGKIYYRLSQHREDAIMVEIAVPGERWEVEFIDDGTVEVEVFRSSGTIEAVDALVTMLAKHADVDHEALVAAADESAEPCLLPVDQTGHTFDDACELRVESAIGVNLSRVPGRATTLFESDDHTIRVLGRMNIGHEMSGQTVFWFNYEDRREEWLLKTNRGYVALACGSCERILLISAEEFSQWTAGMSVTPRTGYKQWNVRVALQNGSYLLLLRGGQQINLEKYFI